MRKGRGGKEEERRKRRGGREGEEKESGVGGSFLDDVMVRSWI